MLAAFLGHFCKKRGKDQIIFKKLKLKRLQEMRYAESGEQRALFDGFVRVTYAQRETVFITLWCGVNFFFPQHDFIFVTSEMAILSLEFTNAHTISARIIMHTAALWTLCCHVSVAAQR